MVNNSLTKSKTKPKFSVVLQSDAIKNLINNTLGDSKKSQRFVTAISSAVATNPALQECDSFSIINGALLGETLSLSPSPQLGHYYLVPYKNKKTGTVATFQLGYKGYIQLAIRSGQYKSINVIDIKEGELVHFDRLSETVNLKFIDDEDIRSTTPTVGYCAMFELVNGFRKVIYWSYKKMLFHADKYSPAFKKEAYSKLIKGEIPNEELWRYSSFWYKDFDGMAFKTMLRQLISKWGIMSIEMQAAFENDMTFKDEQGGVSYVEDDTELPDINSDIEVTENENDDIIPKQEEKPINHQEPVKTDLEGTPVLL